MMMRDSFLVLCLLASKLEKLLIQLDGLQRRLLPERSILVEGL